MVVEELKPIVCSGCGTNITSEQQYNGYVKTDYNKYHYDCWQDYLTKYKISKARFVKGKDLADI